MAASELQISISPFPDKMSMKLQRFYLCFRSLAFQWDSVEYYTIKPEVGNSKMAASLLQHADSSSLRQDMYEFPAAKTTTPMFWKLVGILCDQTGNGNIHDGDLLASTTHMYCFAF